MAAAAPLAQIVAHLRRQARPEGDGCSLRSLMKRLPHVDAEMEPAHGWTALHIACAGRQPELVRALLQEGADTEAASREFRHTPLHVAASLGREVSARMLVEHGARMSAGDAHGYTPLHHACAEGYRAVVEALLELMEKKKCLDLVNSLDSDGNSPLILAQLANNHKVVEVMQRFILQHLPTALVDEHEISEVSSWLSNEVGFPQYVPCFVSSGYTRLSFWATAGLSDEDYRRIGVTLPGHRRIIDSFLRRYSERKGKPENEDTGSEDSD